MSTPLVRPTPRGLYCPPADLYIDPWRPVDRAVVTHAHGDHLTRGSRRVLVSEEGQGVTRARLGDGPTALQALPYGRPLTLGPVTLTLFPAGHILGSAQVRLEYDGRTTVVTGDFKTDPDPTCTTFEPVRCDTLVTESTFALPVYRWPDPAAVAGELNAWWAAARDDGRTAIVYAYSLGKAQRVLAALDPAIGPVFCHGAVQRLNAVYREAGVPLLPTRPAGQFQPGDRGTGALVVAPPSASRHGPWIRRFGTVTTAFASGWMLIRGTRRRRNVDRGFVLSDHADWPGLVDTIAATGATYVRATHGYTDVFARWCEEQGLRADTVPTRFVGERPDEGADEDPPDDDAEDNPGGPRPEEAAA